MAFTNCFLIFTIRPCPSCYSSSFFSPPHWQNDSYPPAILISHEHSHRQSYDEVLRRYLVPSVSVWPLWCLKISQNLEFSPRGLSPVCVHSLPSESTLSPLVSNLFLFPHLPVKRRPLRSQTTRDISSSSRLGTQEGTI